MGWSADGGIGTLIFLAIVIAVMADAWSKRKKELARRQSATQEQREAAERDVPTPETRSVVMEEARPTVAEPPPPRPRRRAQASPLEDPFREIARRLGIPEEILPPPPQNLPEEPREPERPRPKPKPVRVEPAPTEATPPELAVEPVPAPPRRRAPLEEPAPPPPHPLVFHIDPLVNAIIRNEVLMTPRQRRLVRRLRRI